MHAVATTNVLDHGSVSLVDSMPALPPEIDHPQMTASRDRNWGPGDQRIVDAARVSIAGGEVRVTSDSEKLLRYLLANRHTTPFEQVRFTFHVKLPIFIARQWIRHRTGSFNEMSARYGVMPDEFYVPALDRMAEQSKSNKQGSGGVMEHRGASDCAEVIRDASHRAYADYQTLLALGLARELARTVLPVNLYTQWFWTTDLHNLMHFLRLRLHSHAQYEMRVYAEAVRELVRPVVPCAMKAFDESLEDKA